MFLTDSHCHLDQLDFNAESGDLNAALARAAEQGVQHILNVCITLSAFPEVLRIAKAYPFVSASVGLHPNHQDEEVDAQQLVKLAQDSKIVAIGETGLDYYRTTGDVSWQQTRFREHIRAAKKVGKPLIVHMRTATEDTLRIMREEGAHEAGGVMHCFSEDWATAKAAMDMNFYISFSGVVTFRNAQSVQDVAKVIPLDRLLIETDAPYLAPHPHRGKANEPAYVRYTAEALAKLQQIPLETLAEQTTANFFTLFKEAKKTHV